MPLIQMEKACLSYGTLNLLDGLEFSVRKGRRICLVGRNGAGKSTLMKVLSGDIELDSGQVRVKSGTVVARLEQDLPEADELSVYDVVASGLAGAGELLSEYHAISMSADAVSKPLLLVLNYLPRRVCVSFLVAGGAE